MKFELIVGDTLFSRIKENPKLIFKEPEFEKWIKSFRWMPKINASSNNKRENPDFSIDEFGNLDFGGKKYILCIINISNDRYFLPLGFVLEPDFVHEYDINQMETEFLGIKSKSGKSEACFFQAEYDPDFWKGISVRIIDQKNETKGIEIKFTPYDNHMNRFLENSLKSKGLSINILGNGDTTNIALKLKGTGSENNEIVCKVYKKISPNPEISILRHLQSHGFTHIPKIKGLLSIESEIRILFMESLEIQCDAGSVFWTELVGNLKKFAKIDIYREGAERDNLFSSIFPKSREMGIKIGKALQGLHELLRTPSPNDIPEGLTATDLNEEAMNDYDLDSLKEVILGTINQIFPQEMGVKGNGDGTKNGDEIDLFGEIGRNILSKAQKKCLESLSQDTSTIKKQKIHQDLHLGQIILTGNGMRDPVFLDFEGDPQLDEGKKFKKMPIHNDLASIKRALSYIKYNALANSKIMELNLELAKILLNTIGFINGSQNGNQKKNFKRNLKNNNRKIQKRTPKEKPKKIRKNVLLFLEQWEAWAFDGILIGYFGKKFSGKFNADKDFLLDRKIINVYAFTRALSEIKYERSFRPQSQITPLLGLIDQIRYFSQN